MVINQIHSIGDILFLEPMFRYFARERGRKPVVPLRDHLMWLADYIDSARFVPLSTFNFQKEELMVTDNYLPLRWANQIYRGYDPNDHHDFENMMCDKYRLAGLDPEMWREIKLNFKEDKAEQLIKSLQLKKQNGTIINYILVNENSQAGNIVIKPGLSSPIVRMKPIYGFTVIDWYLVMLFALENHHVSTSTFFILQAIKNRLHFESKVFIYPRPNEDGLRGIINLNPSFEYTKM